MTNSMLIIDLIYKEDKFGLHYILTMLDHKRWFYSRDSWHTKNKLRFELITLAVNQPELFLKCHSYKTALQELDLFEQRHLLPKEIIEIFEEFEEPSYKNCKIALLKCEQLGYTFEYGLDAQPFNLKQV